LAAIAIRRDPPAGRLRLDPRTLVLGIVSAAVLWGIFWFGKQISTLIFPFAEGQIGAIYGKGEGFSPTGIFFLLLIVTGPCEEIYWRGFLQKHLMARYGNWQGWLAASAVYAGVHIWSLNFMLIGAAAVAGTFWGLCYWRWGRLAPVIVSHSLWSAVVFSLAPIP
jgi:membrane protease YdiL (CAAX protease family)